MCEWLSYGEWCDVKLLCGGRAFSAHRAVLASVSTFLRQILLSCPTDESPTFIVLPEFDLDAMSSVLYYIYNGEVTVQKQKLDRFLDIIKAMQIFIDSQYLPQTACKNYYYSYLDFNHKTDISKNNIFTLGPENSEDQTCINLKKRNETHNIVSQYLLKSSELRDKCVRNQSLSAERKSSLRNLKSPDGDRQRNSFLRDLFIETYPRNENVNGLTTSVLAISNEYYRAPESVLLTNANGNHLSVDDIRFEPYEKISKQITDSPTVIHIHKQKKCTPSVQDYGETSRSFYDFSLKNIYRSERIKNSSRIQIGLRERVLGGLCVPPIDYGVSSPTVNEVKTAYKSNISVPTSSLLTNINIKYYKHMDKISTPKTTILNHVIDGPWSPRIPQSFKPFRRKPKVSLPSEVTVKNTADNTIVNDSNNNVNKTISSLNLNYCKEIIQPNEEKCNTATSLQDSPDIVRFKCNVCNQVFMTRDLLSVHMRRHTIHARYSCGDCGKTFSQLRNFKYHMSIHRGTREFAATCTVCGKYFNDRGYLSSHMKIHRNRKEYKCNLCPKSFNQRVAYNMHVRIHTGVKPHVCEQCGKAFSRKMLLKQHQRTHSGERPYACPHCDKRFADRSNMTLHLRLHTGIKPFSCTLCPKSFTKKHHLKSHLNFHTGSKPYSCPRCKLAFTQSSNMRTHLKKCRAPET